MNDRTLIEGALGRHSPESLRDFASGIVDDPRHAFEFRVKAVAQAYLDATAPDPRRERIYPSILCASGQYFDYLNPDSFNWGEINDIIHALAAVNRYGGHTRFPYSVAQHSYLASFLVEPEYKFEALMHDAHEFVYGDMMTPFKIMLPDYSAQEKRGEAAMRRAFGLPEEMSEAVKLADLKMLATEYDQLMPAEAIGWDVVRGVERMAGKIQPWSVNVTRQMFATRFWSLWSDWKMRITPPRIDAGLCRVPTALHDVRYANPNAPAKGEEVGG